MQYIANEIISYADRLIAKDNGGLILAIDGRCASGKTTLAKILGEHYGCSVIHTDHFFLRKEQRTDARLREIGGNFDRERFLSEVLLPLRAAHKGDALSYLPYDCSKGALGDRISITKGNISIIEGSYSCHPDLLNFYDIKIFLSAEKEEQMRRIILREGKEKAKSFREKWIPMEEDYFLGFSVKEKCDLIFSTDHASSSGSGSSHKT